MDWLKQNKRGLLLIVIGVLAIVGSYGLLTEEQQRQIVEIIASFLYTIL
ncbi:hypothetical protein [Brevibacillus sp. 1238]|nr:hypothetical protein [Brevibacillus sp. 1238]MDH6351948.1 hypothetical protein [Brevibacillus sp. 1238]